MSGGSAGTQRCGAQVPPCWPSPANEWSPPADAGCPRYACPLMLGAPLMTAMLRGAAPAWDDGVERECGLPCPSASCQRVLACCRYLLVGHDGLGVTLIDLAGFHKLLLREKMQELQDFLRSLGARSITLVSLKTIQDDPQEADPGMIAGKRV